MNANKTVDQDPFMPAIILGATILGASMAWAIGRPSQLVAILVVALMSTTVLFALRKGSRELPLILFLVFGIVFTLGVGSPAWDARSIWLFHAKRIFIEGSLYAQLDNYAVWSHNDYPVVFAALAALLGQAVGHWNEVFPKAAVLFLLFPPLLICSSILGRKLMTFFLLGLGVICKSYLFNGYMDPLVAIYTCAILLLLIDSKHNVQRTSPSVIIVTMIFHFLILLLLKNEGFVIAVVLIAVMFINAEKRKTSLIIGLVSLTAYFVLWKWPVLQANISNDLAATGLVSRIYERLVSWDELSRILAMYLKVCGVYLVIYSTFLLLKKNAWKNQKEIVQFVVAYGAILFLVYLATPHDLSWHLSTSARRTLIPLNVIMLGGFLYSFCTQTKLIKKS
jgi:hypothetical protein